MPSTLAPDRLGVGSRRLPSREIQPPEGEVTLSQELRTVGLLRPHVLVGFRWSYIGLCPGCKSSHNRYIRSFVSHPPQIRACTSRAPGSSSHEFATRAIRRRYVDMVQVTMYLPGFSSTAHETAPPSLDGVPRGWFPRVNSSMRCCDSLPPISPRFVSFAWRYHRCVRCSSPPAPDAEPWINLELVGGISSRLARWKRQGLPSSRRNPRDHSPYSFDPGVTRQAEWTMS